MQPLLIPLLRSTLLQPRRTRSRLRGLNERHLRPYHFLFLSLRDARSHNWRMWLESRMTCSRSCRADNKRKTGWPREKFASSYRRGIDMPKLAIVATIEVAPGRRDQLLPLLMAHRARCLKDEPGTLQFEVLAPREDDTKVLLYGPSIARIRVAAVQERSRLRAQARTQGLPRMEDLCRVEETAA